MFDADRQPVERAIHTLAIPEVYATLASTPAGLTPEEATARLHRWGPNTLHEAQGPPLVTRLLANFTHLMALLLWAGGLIGFIAGMPQLGIAIWAVNLINGTFSFWQEYKAERATAALRRLLPQVARVLRAGQEQRVPADELVPGDVLLLAEGDHISADARLVEAAELRVDQSTLSGESRPVPKSAEPLAGAGLAHTELPNLVFAGTSVVSGTGKALVFATGMRTAFGAIARLTQAIADEPSPLQRELAQVTRVVSAIAVLVGTLFFVLASAVVGIDLAGSFIFAMGMIVAFVPEGMLPTVTLALALGVQRMARRHALVKRLSAVETLGCTSVICTDKTGTLTANEMTVRYVWMADRELEVTGTGYAPQGQFLEHGQPLNGAVADLRQLLTAAALCSDARLVPSTTGSSWTVLGDPTEAALLVAAAKGGIDVAGERRAAPRLRELPFDARRKRMATIHSRGAARVVYVKGAPHELLARCTAVWLGGRAVPLTDDLRRTIAAANDRYASQGLRVLAVATRTIDAQAALGSLSAEVVERDLTFLGLLAMLDPPRPEVAEAITRCHRAGIRIIMITGDYGLTAASIARRIGILTTAQPRIVTGAELEAMDDGSLQDALGGEVIFARVAPEHKLRVVTALQALGHVVAVTGDGVNDAPALKKADIGVAMGLSGTDVAREAADMVLTDDNFATIVNAVEEGRAVYANIRKFITYIFTSNTPEAVPFILFALSRGHIPLALTVMQILAVDLGTDMVPALALGAEPPEPGLMDRPPRRPSEHVITPALLCRAYLWLGPLQSAAAMLAFYHYYWANGFAGRWLDLPATGDLYRSATTVTLAAVVFTQIGNLFAQRSEHVSIIRLGLGGNRLIALGIATELLLLVAIVYLPPLQAVFETAPFTPETWLLLLALTPLLLVADELRKALRLNRGR
ncbi:MAG TPA: cation-transporting P-type ATPase [Roseiflexaceae bacterium]|nr:cation-transporting P-type ATPase [Roseiflexaceae bacterium]